MFLLQSCFLLVSRRYYGISFADLVLLLIIFFSPPIPLKVPEDLKDAKDLIVLNLSHNKISSIPGLVSLHVCDSALTL